MDVFEISRAIGHACDDLRANDVSVLPVIDVEVITRMLHECSKHNVTPKMEHQNNDFNWTNHFWLFAIRDSRAIAGVSVRQDDIGEEHVASYWQRTYGRYYGLGDPFDIIGKDVIGFLSGRLAYVGEMHICKEARGRHDLAAKMSSLIQMTSILKFRPDWVYAFVHERHALLGMPARYGFTRQFRAIRRWVEPPAGRSQTEWLCAVSAREVVHNAKVINAIKEAGEVQDNLVSFVTSGNKEA